jgi:uncharacterized protein YndB with AHSA1/START domain
MCIVRAIDGAVRAVREASRGVPGYADGGRVSMTPQPTGRLVHKDDGLYLLLDRIFASHIESVWASVTRPVEMNKWVGTYKGTPSTGAVMFRMAAQGAEWEHVSILHCEPPHVFHVDIGEGPAARRVFMHLREEGGHTTLTLGERVQGPSDAPSVGPLLDYHLDRLVASREDAPLPTWDDYHPAFVRYYQRLLPLEE